MKYLKKLIIVLICALLFMAIVPVNAVVQESLVINGKEITYKNGEKVLINTEYISKGTEFRGVWVSPLTNDITSYTSMRQYKDQIYQVLEKMDYYNLNVMIFHVRIMNDALYESKYNSWSSYYKDNPDWDALPWIIEECHKRGIEFHAWMNPYRVTTNVSKSLEDIASEFISTNAASNPNNLLKGTTTVILNPGIPEVQDFLINTCMELVNNYDIDAIHFDDYFYTKGIDDTTTYNQYGNGEGISQWRRNQVSNFIRRLSEKLDEYNTQNSRCVQLGISPTGVYRNGNGVVTYDENNNPVTNGSATGGYAHYDSPLYADTLEWIKNEWIDYILPQSYHAITLSASPFCDVIGWWDKVVKYSNVNLYAAMGYYFNGTSGTASWENNPYEAYDQVLFSNSLENVRGTSIYNYNSYVGATSPGSKLYYLKETWSTAAILPEIRTTKALDVGTVSNLEVQKTTKGNKIVFQGLEEAKFYVIYKSTRPLTFSADEVLDIIGDISVNGVINYLDSDLTTEKCYYGIKAQSYSLKLGEAVTCELGTTSGEELYLGEIPSFGISSNIMSGEIVTIYWETLLYPFGNNVEYELSYSFDDGEITTTNNFYMNKNKYNYDIEIPNGISTINISLKAYNNLGETIETITENINDSLPKIKNFGYVGTPYSTEELRFVWNNLSIEEEQKVIYTLQYSKDTYEWQNLMSTKTKDDNLNIRVNQKPQNGKYYYRVQAQLDNSYSYSDVIEITAYKKIGSFDNLKVNGKELPTEFIFNEYEVVDITFDKLTEDEVYVITASDDLKNWVGIRTFSDKVVSEIKGNVVSYKITLPALEFVSYIKITTSSSNSRNESPTIKIKMKTSYIFYDELNSYINSQITIAIQELGLFN